MALSDQDLEKIKAVVNSRADLQDEKLRQVIERLGRVETNMATKEQLEQVKTMLTEDYAAVVGDVEALKDLQARNV